MLRTSGVAYEIFLWLLFCDLILKIFFGNFAVYYHYYFNF